MKNKLFFIVSLMVCLTGFIAGGPSVDASENDTTVMVIEGEWFVMPSPAATSDPHVTFDVHNTSQFQPHEFIVIKLKHGQEYNTLPISTDPYSEFFGRVDEDALGSQIAGAIEDTDLPPGGFALLTVGLSRGDYAVICNLPGHYMAGMRAPFSREGGHGKGGN